MFMLLFDMILSTMTIDNYKRECLGRISSLPCDLQRTIWKEYTQKYVFDELLHKNKLLQYHTELHELFDIAVYAIDKYVKNACLVYNKGGSLYFDISIDFVEDKVIDDDWFDVNTSLKYLKVLYITKAYIQHPHLMKIELESEFLSYARNKYEIYILCSNIDMLTKLLR
mgnify:CR=1 FL=1